MLEPPSICQACGRPFIAARAWQRFCSPTCQDRAKKRRARGQNAGTSLEETADNGPAVSQPAEAAKPAPARDRVSHQADLKPEWAGGSAGYLYSVTFNGETIVTRSRVAELDAVRVLLGRGITGKLTFYADGKPRFTIDIEEAAKLTVREDARIGPLFVKWKPFPDRAQLGEDA
jgi:hypothetical protein